MEIIVWMILALSINQSFCEDNGDPVSNSTSRNKDMYVINAMVYQVGIVSNKTDEDALNGTMGNQEAITLYHTNGTNLDLSQIASPLVTNVTAQRLIGMAPKAEDNLKTHRLPWSALEDLTNQKHSSHGTSVTNQWTIGTTPENKKAHRGTDNAAQRVKRSWEDAFKSLFKRDVMGNNTVKIMKGTAEIPKEAGVQSIALPPLLTLNNNFSDIPVPIPNTSVVHYAKVNTLVRAQ